jgi:hypothetical protein
MADEKSPTSQDRVWQKPTLEELGRLKDFVRVGHAKGKSVLINDGNAEAGGESMP